MSVVNAHELSISQTVGLLTKDFSVQSLKMK